MCGDAVFVENTRYRCEIPAKVPHGTHAITLSDRIIFWSGPIGATKINEKPRGEEALA